MSDPSNGRPLPTPDPATEPYWAAAREHRLSMPRCEACGEFHFYPRPICPHCGTARLTWAEVSGNGTVYSFTIVQRAPSPAFADMVPYVVAIVALDEGPHLMSNIVDCSAEQVRIGMPVRVTFLDSGKELSLPLFKVQ
jgi:uncharacterized OB-fold protein